MKRTIRLIALLLCLALLLPGCGGKRGEEKDAAPVERHRTERRAESTPAPAVTEEPEPFTEPPVAATPAPEAVSVRMTRQDGGDGEKVLIEGLAADGSAVWACTAATDYRTELTLIEEIGAWQDRYYFNKGGTLVCLRIADGETLWENGAFGGASISALVDERNGNVYLCGWYGPDFFACDRDGKTLNRTATVVDGFYWPSDMTWYGENELMIYYNSQEPMLPFVADLTDYSFSWDFRLRELDATQQYWANIFISDFAEQFIKDYPRDGGSDAELSSFAHLFCKINRHSAIVYDKGYETVSLDTVNELCQRFFGREIHPAEGAQYTNDWGMEWKFENGKFWFPAGDGEAYNRFAVVREYLETPGSAVLSFYVYELSLDEYWTSGMDGALYSLTADEAEAMAQTGRITRVGTGQAEALPIEQNGHDGYHLCRLHIDLY